MNDWAHFLAALALAALRLSGMLVFAPFFSSTALPARTKAAFVLVTAWLLAPLVASVPRARAEIGYAPLLGELAVGLVYGLTLALLNETMSFAGQLLGLQFGFSVGNLLDPSSPQQNSLLGDALSRMGVLILLAAGLDRILLASLFRSFRVAPLGGFALAPEPALALVRAAGGVFLAAVELAAPILAATLLVDLAISLLGKLSPQLPAMALTVPVKSLLGYVLLASSFALWPRFVEARFAALLDLAERWIAAGAGG